MNFSHANLCLRRKICRLWKGMVINMSTNTEAQTAGASTGKTKTMALIGVMAAVTCILGPLSLAIPVSPVPISLTNLAVYFAIYVLGMKRGTISYCIYLLLGLAGLLYLQHSQPVQVSSLGLQADISSALSSWH